MSGTGARLPFAGYVPPPAALAAQIPRGGAGGERLDYESWGDTVDWPIAGEVTLWTSEKRWRAVDVYATLPVDLPLGLLFSFFVYAVLPSGVRTLVSSGRLGKLTTAAAGMLPTWVAAGRGQAVKWEVTCRASGSITADKISVAIVASDEANEPPEWVGLVPCGFNTVNPLVNTSVRTTSIFMPELVRVEGVVGAAVAAPRYLHIHDAGAGSMAGVTPLISLPLGAGVGAGGGFGGQWKVNLRTSTINGIFQVVVSSAAGVTALVVDCSVQAWAR